MTEKRQSETPLDLSASVEDAKMHDLKRKNLHGEPSAVGDGKTEQQQQEQQQQEEEASGNLTGPIVKRPKKTSPRCAVCKQKTGLASSYVCRCGSNYCAKHRYAELHQCSYDYREAGKDFLRKMHPMIRPQKIDKI